MNLASRLDRLRGAAAAVGERHAGTGGADVPRNRPGRVPGPRPVAALAEALEAETPSGGLLLCRSEHLVPQLTGTGRDLLGLPEVCGLSDPDWVYVDTETTGLSGGVGTLAFMLGLARFHRAGVLEVRQYLLGSFAAESGMLQGLSRSLGPNTVLVSYNGKCFDVPLLAGRLRMHRIDCNLASLSHLDLMHSVRRAYRGHWPDCRLQTAERQLLDLHRLDDLPGSAAPAAWQSWLRHGRTLPLSRVLAHNRQDVVSLALLHRRLLSDYAGSARPGIDHAAVGRAWLKAGRPLDAQRVWERAGGLLDERGCLQLAGLYRRLGDWSRAESVWLRLHARGSKAGALALSKYYEHRRHDFRRAIEFAGCCDGSEREPRFRRLQHKLGANLELPL